jgi:hypothetical protein
LNDRRFGACELLETLDEVRRILHLHLKTH